MLKLRQPHRTRHDYVFAGPLRWVEPDGRTAVLRVDAAAGKAARFCGRSVTLDLGHARIAGFEPDGAQLRAGDVVTVKARLPRELDTLPDVVTPRAVLTLGPLV